jgi:ribonuclease Z
MHGDHIYGLPGLISSRSFQGGEDQLTIYGPKGLEEFVKTALAVSHSRLTYPIEFVEISEGKVFEDNQFQVIAKKLEHGIESYGYRVIEKDLPGALLINELDKLSIKPGPIYQKIKAGQQVELEDGTVIDGKDFLGPSQKGRIVTILGDTRYTTNSIELAEEADLLIHEATFSEEDEQLAYNYFHSTTKQAAMIAKQSNAKKLLLTHISSRYQTEGDLTALEKEAQALFPLTYLASDFMQIEIPKNRE